MSAEITDSEIVHFRKLARAHYEKLIRSDVTVGKLDFHEGSHLLDMCTAIGGDTVDTGAIATLGPQACMRWLGYLQGVLSARSICTIETLRNDTRRLLWEAETCSHVTLQPAGSSEWSVWVYGECVHPAYGDSSEWGTMVSVIEALWVGRWARMDKPAYLLSTYTQGRPSSATEYMERTAVAGAVAQAMEILNKRPMGSVTFTPTYGGDI